MPQGPFSRIVIRRPNGKVDVIGRVGFVDPHPTSRALQDAGAGEVLAIRHEMMPMAGKPQPVAIHALRK